jgi:antitoxin VapB
MPFSIKNPEADRLVREVMILTGENLTEAVVNALHDRLKRVRGRRQLPSMEERVNQILERVDALPELDHRSADDIIGYDEHGVPR